MRKWPEPCAVPKPEPCTVSTPVLFSKSMTNCLSSFQRPPRSIFGNA